VYTILRYPLTITIGSVLSDIEPDEVNNYRTIQMYILNNEIKMRYREDKNKNGSQGFFRLWCTSERHLHRAHTMEWNPIKASKLKRQRCGHISPISTQ
jgi:hypothetical protein